jgi:hypothetical protein
MARRYEEGESNSKPDVFVCTVLMKCCAHTRGHSAKKNNALRIAFQTMKALEEEGFGPPNHVAYATLITAINRLSRSRLQREELLESALRRCAEGGHVSKDVVSALQETSAHLVPVELHASWSRNVPEVKRPSNQASPS